MRVADIGDLSIEELSNIQITSVSRHAERLSDAPAAIFVITGEDIRRSGATRLSEALRLAPNLEVARSSASSYAISARGFNNTIANKLLVLIDGRTASDGWSKGQVGFRTDWGTAANGFTLQGDAYRGSLDQAIGDDTSISGNNLLGRWNRDLAGWGQLQVQSYFEHTERDIPGTFAERLNIFDVEFQHGLRAIGAHRLTWGGGYRYGDDRVSNSAFLSFLPANRGLRWANVFAQDEIA